MSYPYAAAITLLSVVLMFVASVFVGNARRRHGIRAPATVGHADFERAYRAQMNTLESTAMFLPLLWVASLAGADLAAGALGAVWLVGRGWYIAGYLHSPEKRAYGFAIGFLALAGLFLLCLWSFARPWLT